MSGQCLSVPWNSYNLKFHPWSLCQPFQSESVVFSPPVTQCSYLDHLPGGVITPRTHMPPKILLATLSDHTLNILIESSPSAWAVPSQPSHPVSHDSNQTPPPPAASMSCSPQYTGQRTGFTHQIQGMFTCRYSCGCERQELIRVWWISLSPPAPQLLFKKSFVRCT